LKKKKKGVEAVEVFIKKPSVDLYAGIRVDKDSTLTFENDHVKQELKNLTFYSTTTVKGEGYESVYYTTIYLKEGDILVFEEEGRGYIKPVEEFVTIEEAIADYENIKGVGE
jgi:uncharacterized protein (UPF0297 family)